MTFLSLFRPNQKTQENEILNFGVESLLKLITSPPQSIQEKLSKKFPLLTNSELIEYEIKCKEAKLVGHELIYTTMVTRLKAYDPMTKTELTKLYKNEMTKKFPWLNKSNLKAIYNLACYGLKHDGWLEFKKS